MSHKPVGALEQQKPIGTIEQEKPTGTMRQQHKLGLHDKLHLHRHGDMNTGDEHIIKMVYNMMNENNLLVCAVYEHLGNQFKPQ